MAKKKHVLIILLMFIFIFEPPFLPISFIYVQGIIELFFLFIFKILKNKKIDLEILNISGMSKYYGFIVLLWIMLSVSRIIDIVLFNGEISISNWMKSTNQFIIMTFIEFINLDVLFQYLRKINYSLNDFFECIINVGAIQGIISVFAFIMPSLRMILLKFASDVFTNSWILERRGYGFSQTLLDGFGYGMGLIAGLLILNFKAKSIKSFIIQIIKISLIIFSILVNSRTGLIIVVIALLLKIPMGDNLRITLIKLPITIFLLYVFVYSLVPLINYGMSSMNTNINWISSDIGGLIKALIPSANINTTAAQAHATSNPYYTLITNVQVPNNPLQFMFGKGWQIYEGSRTGYRSDNGYLNMIWMVGVVGTIAYYAYNLYLTMNLIKKTNGKNYLVLIFNYIALLVYSVKGRPVGFTPGIIVFYMIIFGLSYFYSPKKEDK